MTTRHSSPETGPYSAPTDDEVAPKEERSLTTELGMETEGSGLEDTQAAVDQVERTGAATKAQTWRTTRVRALVFGVLPSLALLATLGVGYLKWLEFSSRASDFARIESVRAATDSTIAMLSYKAESVESDLGQAQKRLTGELKSSYTSLTHDVVIPGSKQRQISALANVSAAASVFAAPTHAVVLVFVNQTITMGNDPPTSTASSVRVTLDKVSGRWLISKFDPV